jgi:hypothetical protein
MKNYLTYDSINFAMVLLIIGLAAIVIAVIYSWVNGIDNMHKNHPDYKGDDLFGEDTEKDI